MVKEFQFLGLRFVPLVSDAKIFGFPEYLAGLALMVLVWTIADSRYKFRIEIAPWRPRATTYAVVAGVGILTLLTDLWKASKWPVPVGNFISPASWQAMLGGAFLLTFLAWAFFAFLKPWSFGRVNAKNFTHALARTMLRGSPTDLAVIADELAQSAKYVVRFATERRANRRTGSPKNVSSSPPMVERYANDIFMMIGDRRFCSAVADSAPQFALAIFKEIQEQKRFRVPVHIFASNLLSAAIANKNSFIYHEMEDGFASGFFGYAKPVTLAMFSNYELVEAVDGMLRPDFSECLKWDSTQWEVYFQIVSLVMTDFVWGGGGEGADGAAIYASMSVLEESIRHLPRLNGVGDSTAVSEDLQRVDSLVNFVHRTIKELDEQPLPKSATRKPSSRGQDKLLEALARLIIRLITMGGMVRAPFSDSWLFQHNAIWSGLFAFEHFEGKAGTIVKGKVLRIAWREIKQMETMPNFHGAALLAFFLNVLGVRRWAVPYGDLSVKALHKMILCWTGTNFATLHARRPRYAEACMVDGMTYDAERRWLIKVQEPLSDRKPKVRYMVLDDPH